jgi:hypothetical protein
VGVEHVLRALRSAGDCGAPAVGRGGPPRSPANWNLATGSGTLDHFPIREQLDFAALYDGIAHRQTDIESASDLSQQAESLVPLAKDAEGRRELRVILGRLAGKVETLAHNDDYMRRHFNAVGAKADNRDITADSDQSPQCR